MNRSAHLILLAFMLVLAAPGCHRHPTDSGRRAPDFPTNVIAYEVKGVLKEIRPGGRNALIAHENIPGYMEAMTMLFDVKQTNELAAVRPGDAIRFRMLVTDSDGWIDRVELLAGSVAPSNPPPASASSLAEDDELSPGSLVPDCVLTNQLGQPIRLSDFRGRALAFTFIFIRCPFPVYCPRMNNNLGAVQRQLSEPGNGTNWHLLSISFDPEFDTPAQLARYARTYHHDPARWSFATGAAEDIRNLGRQFGLLFWREGVLFNHNVRTVVVDPAGRVQKVFTGNEWKPSELADEMQKAMKIEP